MKLNSSKFELLWYHHPNVKTPSDHLKIRSLNNIVLWKISRVFLSDDVSFQQQIDNIIVKARQTVGWFRRTFKTRESTVLLTMYKPLLGYHCVLWNPKKIREIWRLEAVQRPFSPRMIGMQEINYRERSKTLKLYVRSGSKTLTIHHYIHLENYQRANS